MGLRLALLALALAVGLHAPPAARAAPAPREADAMILEARVNGVRKGDVLVIPGGEPDTWWIKAPDFERLGIGLAGLRRLSLGTVEYLLLGPSSRLRLRVDLDRLALELDADPALLGRQTISLSRAASTAPSPSPGPNGFLNYAVSLQRVSGVAPVTSVDLAPNLALGSWVFRSEHTAVNQGRDPEHLRLRSYAARDFPEHMLRLMLGDISPAGGAFGRAGTLGGFSLTRRFELQPGFVRAPTLAHTGSLTQPATAEIFVDGTRLRSVALKPGLYEFRDLYYFSGLRNVEIVVTDALGRRETTVLPFYFSDDVLAAGLHEFSYSAGRLRRGLDAGGGYGEIGVAAVHRVGLTSAITVGGAFEHFPGYRALSASASARLGRAGTVAVNAAHSRSPRLDGAGGALLGSYAYASGRAALGASVLHQSRGFGRFDDGTATSIAPPALRMQLNASIGIGLGAGQSLSLDYARTRTWDAPETALVALRHAWTLGRGVTLGTSVARRRDGTLAGTEVSLTLSVSLDREWNANGRVERRPNGEQVESWRLTRAIPASGGLGGRLGIDTTSTSRASEVFVQHNGNYGTVRASTRRQEALGGPPITGSELQFSGSLAFVGTDLFLARTVDQGFAVIDVAGLPGVRVYQNNQLVGRTRTDGRLLAASLGSYTQNQIRIDDRDIPLDIQLDRVSDIVVPRAQSGARVVFAAKRVAAVGGRLVARLDGTPVPAAAAALAVRGGTRDIDTTTGPDGDFYLEDLGPGRYLLRAVGGRIRCRAQFTLVESKGPFTDLGAIDCEDAPD